MAHLEIRVARAEDQEGVLAFSENTWEWGDYIGQVWERWLLDTQGRLFVALLEGEPVGLVHVHMQDKGNAWLEGLRVSPQQRGQGVARALTEQAMLEAMQRGAEYIRLITEARNEQAIRLFKSMHLRQVASFFLYKAPPFTPGARPKSNEQVRLATPDDLDDIINYLNVSNIFPLVGGLYYAGFEAYPITADFLEEQIASQHIYVLHRWERLDGLAIAEPREELGQQRLSLGYIDGTAIEAISLLAYELRHLLLEMELEIIRVYALDLVIMHDALNGIGYERGELLFHTYERGLF